MSYYTNSTEIYDVSLIKHSSITHKIFKKNGYDFIFIESGGNSQISCNGKEDLCIKGGYFSDDIALLLQMTPLWRLMRSEYFNLYRYFESFYFLTDLESSINLALDKYKNNSNNFLLFAHILSPHEPKRYNSDCSKFISLNPGLGNPTFHQYKTDVLCISLEAIDTIDKILKVDKSDPIIILASDHGVASSIFKNRFPNIDNQEPLLRLKNFSSIKSPNSCTQYLYDNISPANYFKFVFSCLNQEKNEYLEDLYYLNKDEYGVLNNVTNLVNESKYE